jgi:hypothetical protein
MQRREYSAGAVRLSEAKTFNLSVWVTDSDSMCYVYGGSNTNGNGPCLLQNTRLSSYISKNILYIYTHTHTHTYIHTCIFIWVRGGGCKIKIYTTLLYISSMYLLQASRNSQINGTRKSHFVRTMKFTKDKWQNKTPKYREAL